MDAVRIKKKKVSDYVSTIKKLEAMKIAHQNWIDLHNELVESIVGGDFTIEEQLDLARRLATMSDGKPREFCQ